MTLLLAMAFAFWLQKAVPDLAAAARGKTPPSHEYRMEKLRQRGETTSPADMPSGVVAERSSVREVAGAHWKMAAQRALRKAELRHQRKLELIDERAPRRSEKWLERQRAKADRREQRREKFAEKAGVVTEKAKQAAQQAVEPVREWREERRAWKENARRDAESADPASEQTGREPGQAGDRTGEPAEQPAAENKSGQDGQGGQGATVLEFKRPSNRDESSDPAGTGTMERSAGADPVDTANAPVDDEERWVRNPYFRADNDEPPFISVAELRRCRAAEQEQRRLAWEAEQKQADREHAERLAELTGQHPHTGSEADRAGTAVQSAPVPDPPSTCDDGSEEPRMHQPETAPEPDSDSPFHPRVDWIRAHFDGDERKDALAKVAGVEQWRNTSWTEYGLAERATEKLREQDSVNTDTDTGMSGSVPPPQSPSGTASNEHTGGNSMASQSGEIANLGQARAYSASMRDYLGRIGSKLDADVADRRTMADDLAKELNESELAVSNLQRLGMAGAHVDSLAAAAEKLAQIQQAMAAEAERMAPLLETASAAREAYARALQIFQSQSGLAEQVQATNASGATAANNTEFYANA